ncbi:hypothetical protein [Duganella radicis]|uniref:Uncharacterized protein n=1 Tax=Duganella radicis TaxID=551988 RepID=A0A6L6PQI8_9BURK|nr:hypothetical protein [Duganella radicis]MTV41069.1 hypothetical protein [Duganella radicis]
MAGAITSRPSSMQDGATKGSESAMDDMDATNKASSAVDYLKAQQKLEKKGRDAALENI